jgi:hypothetical protein
MITIYVVENNRFQGTGALAGLFPRLPHLADRANEIDQHG